MTTQPAKSPEIVKVAEVILAYTKSLGKDVPEEWNPLMDPFKDFGLKSRDGADLAEEFGNAFGYDLPPDCNPLVKKNAEGKKRARNLAEIAEFLKTQKPTK